MHYIHHISRITLTWRWMIINQKANMCKLSHWSNTTANIHWLYDILLFAFGSLKITAYLWKMLKRHPRPNNFAECSSQKTSRVKAWMLVVKVFQMSKVDCSASCSEKIENLNWSEALCLNVSYKQPLQGFKIHIFVICSLPKDGKNMRHENSNQWEDEKKQRSPHGRSSEGLETLQL